MALPPVAVEFTVEGLENVKTAFGEVSNASQRTKESVERDSKEMVTGLRIFGRELFIVAQSGRLVVEFAEQFGVLDQEIAKTLKSGLSLISMMGGLASSLGMLARLTEGLNAAKLVGIAADIKAAISTAGHTIAVAAHTIATWALNAALAVKIGLLTLGVGLIIAAAATTLYMAQVTQQAAEVEKQHGAALDSSAASAKSYSRELDNAATSTERLTTAEQRAAGRRFYGPVYEAVPSLQQGGIVPYTGLYELHVGEKVLPNKGSPGVNIGPFIFQGLTIRKESDIDIIRKAVRQELEDSVSYLKSKGMI